MIGGEISTLKHRYHDLDTCYKALRTPRMTTELYHTPEFCYRTSHIDLYAEDLSHRAHIATALLTTACSSHKRYSLMRSARSRCL